MWWAVGVIAVVVLLGVIACCAAACSKGGEHRWVVLGRHHGRFSANFQDGNRITFSGYIELNHCVKCDAREAYRWLDCNDSEHGGRKEIDVAYAENALRKAGVLKDQLA